ncbi:hypothetical protein PMG71_01075 [Roseofilum sp. BLCC_M154]|uniref:Uncharacterized protein n=1 Tax=Roseofilum acuticapitatum BLCC-M154 TaxID=3022444 RepID=A0ABT7AM90_9CYAN|nr:hypothetical protein [Roseofilum acuticapitatum]MDJ1168014.1 hypothetical protein [Roseofilum acuticapitatum BLCC-M154]
MTNQKLGVKIGSSELSTIISNYTITLSEKTYHSLLEVVEKQGLTPEAWIIAQLPKLQPDHQFKPIHSDRHLRTIQQQKLKSFPETTLNEVAGCLKYEGIPKTLDDLEDAIRQGLEE